MAKFFKIKSKKIGDNYPCFLIAEIGSNHNRSKTTVKKLIQEAANAGFDAVKFQIYDPKEIFSEKITTKNVKLESLYGSKPWWTVARDRILMPRDWFREMFDHAKSLGLITFSSIHSLNDINFLRKLNVPVLKIASIDLTYTELVKGLVKYKLPMIVSTGMGKISEITKTYKILKKNGCKNFAFLHCVSCYPPAPEEVNLKNILSFKKKYKIPIGFSDHSEGVAQSVASIALGANIIERHITLNKKFPGPDHPFALDPAEMKRFVKEVREVEKALGSFNRSLSKREFLNRKVIRRSIVLNQSVEKNEILTREHVKFSRPGTGIDINYIDKILGLKFKKKLKAQSILQISNLKK
jgi:sialic acid synthase SpsE